MTCTVRERTCICNGHANKIEIPLKCACQLEADWSDESA